jgi:hypothetical protein
VDQPIVVKKDREKAVNQQLSININMATELTVQSERAFQKQPHIFLNSKAKATKRRPGKAGRRWYKDIGLGFKTPKTAIEGTYIGASWSYPIGKYRNWIMREYLG